MMQGSELPFLSNWQNFYMIMGTAAATLTGLMFVVTTLVAAFMFPKNPSPALYMVSSAMMMLLLVGIRNAWDMVTFLAVERSHSETRSSE
jgi:hypothetical protein